MYLPRGCSWDNYARYARHLPNKDGSMHKQTHCTSQSLRRYFAPLYIYVHEIRGHKGNRMGDISLFGIRPDLL